MLKRKEIRVGKKNHQVDENLLEYMLRGYSPKIGGRATTTKKKHENRYNKKLVARPEHTSGILFLR